MKNLSIIFILLSFCVVFFSGCKKEENNPTPSVREQLIGKVESSITKTERYNANGQLEYENFANSTSNSFIEYREDGTFNSLFPSTPEGDNGTWEVIENGSKLRMLFIANNQELIQTIDELSEDKLVCSSEVEVPTGGVIKYKNTFAR